MSDKNKISIFVYVSILINLIVLALFITFVFGLKKDAFDVDTKKLDRNALICQNSIVNLVKDYDERLNKIVDSYPFIAYVQTFIPGATFFWGLLGNSLAPQDIMFSYRMCYELNPSLFVNGSGLGWTILSDLYVFSFGNIILFIALSLGVGCLFGMLENFSEKYKLYSYITFYVFMKCMLLPRGAGLIPELVYGLVYLLFFCVVFYFLKNYGRSKQQCLQ